MNELTILLICQTL